MGKTSTEQQTKITHEIFLGLHRNGFVEEKTLIQLYCEKCQMFLPDRYLRGFLLSQRLCWKKSVG